MSTAQFKLSGAQARNKKNFDARMRKTKEVLKPDSHAFVRKEYYGKDMLKHKFAPIAIGPFRVVSFNPYSTVSDINKENERFSLDSLVLSPSPEAALQQNRLPIGDTNSENGSAERTKQVQDPKRSVKDPEGAETNPRDVRHEVPSRVHSQSRRQEAERTKSNLAKQPAKTALHHSFRVLCICDPIIVKKLSAVSLIFIYWR